jgi:hypothetical protein
VSGKDKITVITKMVLNETKWLLELIGSSKSQIWRLCYELSKQLQDLNIDEALLSETHLKPRERFFIPDYHFYQTD